MKTIILFSLIIVSTLGCQTNSDCLRGAPCLESVCQCSFMFDGENCQNVAKLDAWIAYFVIICLAHFLIVVFAFYQLRRSIEDKKIIKNMVTAELMALIVASTRTFRHYDFFLRI